MEGFNLEGKCIDTICSFDKQNYSISGMEWCGSGLFIIYHSCCFFNIHNVDHGSCLNRECPEMPHYITRFTNSKNIKHRNKDKSLILIACAKAYYIYNRTGLYPRKIKRKRYYERDFVLQSQGCVYELERISTTHGIVHFLEGDNLNENTTRKCEIRCYGSEVAIFDNRIYMTNPDLACIDVWDLSAITATFVLRIETPAHVPGERMSIFVTAAPFQKPDYKDSIWIIATIETIATDKCGRLLIYNGRGAFVRSMDLQHVCPTQEHNTRILRLAYTHGRLAVEHDSVERDWDDAGELRMGSVVLYK